MPDALVTDFITAIERGNLPHALTLLAGDCEYDNVPMGKVFGPEAVGQTLAPFFDRFDEVEWVVHHQVASGTLEHGVVMNERSDRFRTGDRWASLPVAGVFVIDNGKISLWRDYFDRESVLRLLAGDAGETEPTGQAG
ncbi:MAG: limonene-1,2-epoxide hydrolase family protein [Ilumatobacteraceae bacterium]